MNSLPTFIEYLLLTHDFVVVPGMGTFIAQQAAAQRNEEEETFLPPIRSLRFNANLQHKDSLLRNTASRVYDIPVEEAERMVSNWVAEFKQTLSRDSELEFGTIGVFRRGQGGAIDFTSHEAGVATPDFYGLDAFHIGEVHPEPQARIVPLTATMETSDKEITIHINRRIANFFVAACAAILLFIIFDSPLPTSVTAEQRSSLRQLLVGQWEQDAPSVTPIGLPRLEKPKPKVEKTETESPRTEEPNDEQPTVEQTKHEEPVAAMPKASTTTAVPEPTVETKTVTQQQTPQYCIVMASAISKANAERYATRLREQGYNNPRVHTTNNMVRVVVGNYESESEAYRVADAMRRNSRELESVWILKL